MSPNSHYNSDKCHYETLGVAKTATIDEIKKQFRTLSLKLHPDMNIHNSNNSNNNSEQYKRISNAASILTNPKLKRIYDLSQSSTSPSYYTERGSRSHTGSSNFHKGSSGNSHSNYYNSSSTPFIVQLLRPRNIVLGPILLFISVSTIQYIFNIVDPHSMEANRKMFLSSINNDDTNDTQQQSNPFYQREMSHTDMVLAWKNPISNQYETPAPWDPIYQQTQPELQYVPRHKVVPRTPGSR